MIRVHRVTDADGIAACIAIRQEVFVVGQAVPRELEVDGRDPECHHYLLQNEDVPIGTARILPLGRTAKVQRVAVLKAHRRDGCGTVLMRWLLDDARRTGFVRAVLSAQIPAIPFYERLGFNAHGPEYLDANIPHRDMTLVF